MKLAFCYGKFTSILLNLPVKTGMWRQNQNLGTIAEVLTRIAIDQRSVEDECQML